MPTVNARTVMVHRTHFIATSFFDKLSTLCWCCNASTVYSVLMSSSSDVKSSSECMILLSTQLHGTEDILEHLSL